MQRGLFFRGAEPLPFGEEIRPVRDLIRFMLEGEKDDAEGLARRDESPAAVT